MSNRRTFDVQINDARRHALAEELELKGFCPVVFIPTAEKKITEFGFQYLFGDFDPATHIIRVVLGTEWLQNTALPLVRSHIVTVLLHEFRHAHQYDHWAPHKIADSKLVAYGMSPMEQDANDFAALRSKEYRDLIRVMLGPRPSSFNFGHGPRGLAKLDSAA